MRWKYRRLLATFQSTLPARGATGHLNRVGLRLLISIHAPRTGSDTSRGTMPLQSPKNFNPRSPHGERHRCSEASKPSAKISIHAPRTGSDCRRDPPKYLQDISIHAPRTGSDLYNTNCLEKQIHFNPRSPHGERPAPTRSSRSWITNFNPRSPHGERRERSAIW